MMTSCLFDFDHTLAADYLGKFDLPWKAIPGICDFIMELGPTLDPSDYDHPSDNVWIHKTATVFHSAEIVGPVIIGPRTGVFHCAMVRNGVLIGADCMIGSSVEIKNSIIMDNAEISHFNYVGDSIIGYGSHMGAGAITSNVKSDRSNIRVHAEQEYDTDVWKLGAMIGDNVEIGCNTVLNPGSVIGRNCIVYPCISVRGTVPSDSILKTGNIIVKRLAF